MQLMKYLFLITFLMVSEHASAQSTNSNISRNLKRQNNLVLLDTIPSLKAHKQITIIPYLKGLHKTPLVKLKNNGTYLGKLKDGLSLYRMNLDNMPCIAPDSNYSTKMPIAKR